MKVKELVEMLLKQDQELEVYVDAPRDGMVGVLCVEEIPERKAIHGSEIYSKHVIVSTYYD